MKVALKLFLPYIDMSVLCICTAVAVKQSKSQAEIWSILSSDEWHELCTQSDSFSAKAETGIVDVCAWILSTAS